MVRHVGRLKLGSKPAQTAQPTSVPRQLGNYKVLSSSVRLFTFYTLPDTRVLSSYEELCIMRAAAENAFAIVLSRHGDLTERKCTDMKTKIFEEGFIYSSIIFD